MKAQQNRLEQTLLREGWQVADRSTPSDWWLDEVWTIESQRTPVGHRAYVSFLVDPQAPTQRRKGQDVWAVYVGPEVPTSATPKAAVPLRPNWDRVRSPELARRIKGLRKVIG